jgi:very-short-patch-repair endonuclease
VRTLGIEIDFLVGTVAIEVNGHGQDVERSKLLASHGYTPIHMSNEFIRNNRADLKKILTNITNYGTITPGEHSLPRS